ncbi:MAG: regulatory subunit of cyclin-dependent kinase [Linnemannia gamsii]|nr:MAG: regulatory subunit of cyclin-dependent kinase [Linnemannia gamsii]
MLSSNAGVANAPDPSLNHHGHQQPHNVTGNNNAHIPQHGHQQPQDHHHHSHHNQQPSHHNHHHSRQDEEKARLRAEQRAKDIAKNQEHIFYSTRYYDDVWEYRHVSLPKPIARHVPNDLMTEEEWRSLGVKQSQGWEHYMIHSPEPHVLLFKREKDYQIKYLNAPPPKQP